MISSLDYTVSNNALCKEHCLLVMLAAWLWGGSVDLSFGQHLFDGLHTWSKFFTVIHGAQTMNPNGDPLTFLCLASAWGWHLWFQVKYLYWKDWHETWYTHSCVLWIVIMILWLDIECHHQVKMSIVYDQIPALLMTPQLYWELYFCTLTCRTKKVNMLTA